MTPAPCSAPPALPCRPDCRGWVLRGPVLHGCTACDEWTDGEVVLHLDTCAACRDLAVLEGAMEPVERLFEGLQLEHTPAGWVASVIIRQREIVRTALYPERADAREAGMGWLRRLRGRP